ncbi:hypothetical protein KSP40_PGU004793 [Platanthera guangdongensis]|uniref:Uncharacterized protein n=1 Tax=Platanthera guangdongensis TaxID=2320717 RepID=A0ABR2MXT6_9ASPA
MRRAGKRESGLRRRRRVSPEESGGGGGRFHRMQSRSGAPNIGKGVSEMVWKLKNKRRRHLGDNLEITNVPVVWNPNDRNSVAEEKLGFFYRLF